MPSSAFVRYTFAVLAVALASLLRWILAPALGEGVPFILYFPTVVVCAWFGGLWPGLLSAVLGGFVAWYVFVPLSHSFRVSDPTALAQLTMFLMASALISVLAERLHRARRRAEEGETRERALRERFRVTLASLGDAVIATDAEGRVTLMNEVAESLTGWKFEEASGRPLDDVFTIVNEQTRETVGNPALRAIREGAIVGLANHTVLVTKHGAEIPIDDSGAPIRDVDGRMLGGVLIFRDITERRRAEGRFRLAVESAPNAMLMVDRNGRIVLVNSETERLFGYARGELIGQPVEVLVPERFRPTHPRDRASFQAAPRMRAMGAGRDLYGVRKDGSEVPIEIGLNPLEVEGETLVLGAIVDITERKQAEQRRSLQHAVTRLLAEAASFEDVTPEVLRLIGEELGWDLAVLWTVDRDTNVLRCVEVWRRPAAKLSAFEATTRQRTFARGVGLPGRVWATGEPVWIPSAVEEKDFLCESDAAAGGVGGAIFIPILVGNDVTGVIEVLSQRVQPPDPDVLVTMSSVASRIGHSLERRDADGERARLLAREQDARREAEAANRSKDEFLAMLSHELRTPLSTILGWTRMLRSGQTLPAQAEHGLASIERNAQLQARLIEDLLDVSRIVSGKLSIETRRVDLGAVVDAALEAARSSADNAGIRLALDIDRAVPPLPGDPARVQQIVSNLLSNAIKFSGRGGRVDVRVRRVDGWVEIGVQDTGRGIRPEFLPYVFDRFRQDDSSALTATSGLGIGLSIVRHLVERHGGTVEAASDGEGRGANFTVRLPLGQLPGERRETSEQGDGSEWPHSGATLEGMRILVVDDDRDTRELLEAILGAAHAEVRLVRSVKEAREAIEKYPLDVLISDGSMAGEDGYALIRHVRATVTPPRHLVAIALTGRARDEDRASALAAGFDAHLAKPADPSALVALIARSRAPRPS